MPSVLCRAILFLSGYAPLLLIFTIQIYQQHRFWALFPLGIGLVATVGLLLFLRWVRTGAARSMCVKSVARKDAEVIAYIFAYVFPFLGMDLNNLSSILGLGVFFLVLMVLNVSSNMVHINPALSLLGYHVYEIGTKEGDPYTVVTKRSRLIAGTELNVVIIGDGLSMEK